MRLVIFGLSITSSWGNGHASTYRSLLSALAQRGHSITFYERDVEYYALRRDLHHPPYLKLRLYQRWDDIRAVALAEARAADVVLTTSFCPDGAQIQSELFGLNGAINVFYDLDTPVTLAGLEQNLPATLAYLRADHIPKFDLYLSFSGGPIVRELAERWGARRAAPLYLCIDPQQYQRAARVPEYTCALSFLGTYSADRRAKIFELLLEPARRLADRGFVLAGPLYPDDMAFPENLRRYDHLAGGEHAKFYSSSEFTLNLTREAMLRAGYSPQGRLFEAACCQTTILTDRWPGLAEFFTDGDDVLVVDSADDVVRALRELSEAERERLARRARDRVMALHSGARRALEFEHTIDRIGRVRAPAEAAPAGRQPVDEAAQRS